MAKILLVEDDKSLREIYGVRLMAEGYEIVSAGDGEEALAMAIKERPDLIVSDVMMPKISGFDMLDILRSTSETKGVKVIMMTALSSDDQRARGEALGADRYLVKSQVGIEDVVRTVHDVLGDSITPAAPAMPSYTPAAVPVDAPAPQPQPVTEAPQAPAPAPQPVAAAPAFEPAPLPAPAPATPAFEPAPVAQLVAAPTFEPRPATPVQPRPAEPAAPVAAPAPVAPATPVAPAFEPAPLPNPAPAPAAPAFEPAPVAPQPAPAAAPVFTAPAPAPTSGTLNELPATPTQLPQPTAPFSSPAPASLGERVIEPLTNISTEPSADIASQMAQELNTPPATNPGVPPVPPAA